MLGRFFEVFIEVARPKNEYWGRGIFNVIDLYLLAFLTFPKLLSVEADTSEVTDSILCQNETKQTLHS